MKIELVCQSCGTEIPTGAWYNTREGIALLVPSVCKCMRTVKVPKTGKQVARELDDIYNDLIQELVEDYGAEAVIRAAEGMVKK